MSTSSEQQLLQVIYDTVRQTQEDVKEQRIDMAKMKDDLSKELTRTKEELNTKIHENEKEMDRLKIKVALMASAVAIAAQWLLQKMSSVFFS